MSTSARTSRQATSIPFSEAQQRFACLGEANFLIVHFDSSDPVTLYEGDVEITGDVDGWELELGDAQDAALIVVDGDLTIHGTLSWDTERPLGWLVVTGDLAVDSAWLKYRSNVLVQGNLTARDGVFGQNGDDDGSLFVLGRAQARYLVNCSYFYMHLLGECSAVIVTDDRNSNSDAAGRGATVVDERERELLVPDVVGPRGFNIQRAYELVSAGADIVIPEVLRRQAR